MSNQSVKLGELCPEFGRNRRSYQSKEVLWKKISKNLIFSIGAKTILMLSFPLKCHFLQIFKIILESSLIAHSIGYFILKNFSSEHFLIKLISYEIWRLIEVYDVMWRHIRIWRFIEKWSELKFFSIKFPIEWAIGELSTIILKLCKKMVFSPFKIKNIENSSELIGLKFQKIVSAMSMNSALGWIARREQCVGHA